MLQFTLYLSAFLHKHIECIVIPFVKIGQFTLIRENRAVVRMTIGFLVKIAITSCRIWISNQRSMKKAKVFYKTANTKYKQCKTINSYILMKRVWYPFYKRAISLSFLRSLFLPFFWRSFYTYFLLTNRLWLCKKGF